MSKYIQQNQNNVVIVMKFEHGSDNYSVSNPVLIQSINGSQYSQFCCTI